MAQFSDGRQLCSSSTPCDCVCLTEPLPGMKVIQENKVFFFVSRNRLNGDPPVGFITYTVLVLRKFEATIGSRKQKETSDISLSTQ